MEHKENHDQLRALIRCAGNQKRLAAIVGVSEEQVSRWKAGVYPIPAWVPVMAECLDAMPRGQWPERWRA